MPANHRILAVLALAALVAACSQKPSASAAAHTKLIVPVTVGKWQTKRAPRSRFEGDDTRALI